ncbi:heterokaryon incompatibility protein [Colletotrichum zoysiae]|uniref:Heterokaryon incompatibility protein n=1 Tax=Colletotrichum zoysiae TaxID=1216348 RepID=A0AAD9M6M2_9PEZI|nr:heterokaryon incompatibility protein [Colletotrichum zoysiae]
MTTKIVPLSLDDALKHVSNADRTTKAKSFGFLDTLGTAGCLLNCDGYASRQKLSLDAIEQPLASSEEIVKRGKRRVVQGKLFTYEDLVKSSSSGCGSCRAVKAILDAVPSHHYGKLLPSTAIRWTARDSGTLELAAPDGKEYYLRLFSLVGSVNVFRRFPTANALAGDTSSDVSFRRVRAWLDVCEAGHKKCGKGTDTKLPTRLIDVTRPGDRAGVRLVETAGKTGTYMCLSHCWGKIKINSITRKDNLKRRLSLIPWALLPPSFQHAVEMTRKLGVRYLWIDSLCIIQDDKEDWEREAAQMVNVYRNSYATIAVSWSQDSQGGCYSRTIPSLCFRMTKPGGDVFTIALGIGAKRDGTREYAKVQAYFPLFNRAWCLQERLLSRRVIHFNYGEMAFDCGDGYSCECGGRQHYNWHNVIKLEGPYTPLPSRSRYLALLDNRTSSTAITTKTGEKIEPYERWHLVVSGYTCLNLTNASDMLPALSGLAHETAELVDDTFLAGLWKNNLEQDLMWRVDAVAEWRHERARILKRGWVAPSWSWASTGSGCKVGFPVFQGTPVLDYKTAGMAESCEITCPPAGADPFGSVSYGLLRVTAKRLPVLVQRPCFRWKAQRQWSTKKYGKFRLYAREDQREWHDCFPATGAAPLEFGPAKADLAVDPSVERMEGCCLRNEDPAAAHPGACGRCLFLPAELLYVKGLKTGQGAPSTSTTDFFLIVARDATSSYIRVGRLDVICGSRDERDDWFERVWESWNQSGRKGSSDTHISIICLCYSTLFYIVKFHMGDIVSGSTYDAGLSVGIIQENELLA